VTDERTITLAEMKAAISAAQRPPGPGVHIRQSAGETWVRIGDEDERRVVVHPTDAQRAEAVQALRDFADRLERRSDMQAEIEIKWTRAKVLQVDHAGPFSAVDEGRLWLVAR
jgi:hypothetical protein